MREKEKKLKEEEKIAANKALQDAEYSLAAVKAKTR